MAPEDATCNGPAINAHTTLDVSGGEPARYLDIPGTGAAAAPDSWDKEDDADSTVPPPCP